MDAKLTPTALGAAFRTERIALGKTQVEIAAGVGCRRQTIIDLEAGKNVSLNTLLAALAALGKGVAIVDSRMDVDRLSSLLDHNDED